MKFRTFLIPVFSFFLASAAGLSQEMGTYVPGPQNSSLATRKVTSFAMGSKELMWIGTDDGLFSFDGTHYRPYFHAPERETSLPSSRITFLLGDQQQRLWAGTEQGLARYLTGGRFRRYACGPVRQLVETSDGRIFVSSGRDVLSVDPQADTLSLVREIRPERDDAPLIPDLDGGLWLCTDEGYRHYDYLLHLTGTVPTRAPVPERILAARVGQRLWCIRGTILEGLDLDSGEVVWSRDDPSFGNVSAVFTDGTRLLLKNDKTGIEYFHPEQMILRHPRLPLGQEKDITCLYRDRMDNFWIGYGHYGCRYLCRSDQILYQLNENSLRRETKGEYIVSLSRGPDGTVWGSTYDYLFSCDPSGHALTPYPAERILPAGAVSLQDLRQTAVSENGGLWILTKGRIALAGKSGPALRIEWSHPLDEGVDHIVCVGGKCFALSGQDGAILAFSPGGEKESIALDHPSFGPGSRLVAGGNGRLFVLLRGGGVLSYDMEKSDVSAWSPGGPDADSSQALTTAAFTPSGLYFAPEAGGLYRVEGNGEPPLEVPSFDGIHVNDIAWLESESSLFLCTDQGLVHYKPSDGSILFHNLMMDNRPVTAFHPGCILSDGASLILGSNDGCITLPARSLSSNQDHHVSVHAVHALTVNGPQRILLPDERRCELTHRQNSFEILFGAVMYDRQPIVIQYMLEGIDRNWITAGRDNYASYAKVPAGRYDFRLRELQPFTGKVLHEEALQMKIRRAPWASIPALIGYLLLGIGLLALTLRTLYRIKAGRWNWKWRTRKRNWSAGPTG